MDMIFGIGAPMDTGSKISRPLVFLPFTITASGLHNYISLRTAFIHGISSISSYYSATATLFIGSLMVYSSAFLSSTYSRIDSLHVSVIYEVSMSPANRINGYQLNLTNDVMSHGGLRTMLAKWHQTDPALVRSQLIHIKP